jgi:hypothetical protein
VFHSGDAPSGTAELALSLQVAAWSAANCPELLIIPTLVQIIWNFPGHARPAFLAEFKQWTGHKTILHVRSDKELSALLAQLERAAEGQGRRPGENALPGAA